MRVSRTRITAAAVAAATLWAAATAHADNAPLSAAALSQCATQMQYLRAESTRLNKVNAGLDQRRIAINQRGDALAAEQPTLSPNDLRQGLDWRERLKTQQADATAFNAEIEQVKTQINALNQVKAQYDSGCASRPYDHKDFAKLAPEQRAAMQTGLTDVVVPYLDPAAAAPAPSPSRP